MNIAKKLVDESSITFIWADETSENISLDFFSEAVINRAALHGFSQKLGDSYSGITDVAEAKLAMHGVLAALKAGDWNRKGGSTGGIWVEALARATGETIERVMEAWDKMTDEVKAASKKHPDAIKAKAEIELERAQARAASLADSGDVEPLTL